MLYSCTHMTTVGVKGFKLLVNDIDRLLLITQTSDRQIAQRDRPMAQIRRLGVTPILLKLCRTLPIHAV